MKYILLLFMAFSGLCASAQISASGGSVYLQEGGITSYYEPTIYVSPRYDIRAQTWTVKCIMVSTPGTYEDLSEFVLIFTKAQMDAYTGTGTGDTAKMINAAEQAVIAHLAAIDDNTTIIFSH
jgi:hypothetical protein